jgi:hypothetical protein
MLADVEGALAIAAGPVAKCRGGGEGVTAGDWIDTFPSVAASAIFVITGKNSRREERGSHFIFLL